MKYNLLLCLFTIPFYGFWRRWFGGCTFHTKIMDCRRWVIVTVYMLITIPLVYFLAHPLISLYFLSYDKHIALIYSIIFASLTYICFWSRGHGACFDLGRDYPPDQKTIDRYNERWYHYVCDWIIPKSHRYGFLYDFIYMGLRYTSPCICIFLIYLLSLCFGYNLSISYKFIYIGLSVSPIYAFNWTLYNMEKWIFLNRKTIDGPTSLSEWAVGCIFGLFPLMLP